MTEWGWTWLGLVGIAALVVVVLQAFRREPRVSVIPVIERRRELQEELATLVSPQVGAVLVREESTRRKKAPWDIDVLSAAVHRAKAARARHDQLEANRKTLRTS